MIALSVLYNSQYSHSICILSLPPKVAPHLSVAGHKNPQYKPQSLRRLPVLNFSLLHKNRSRLFSAYNKTKQPNWNFPKLKIKTETPTSALKQMPKNFKVKKPNNFKQ